MKSKQKENVKNIFKGVKVRISRIKNKLRYRSKQDKWNGCVFFYVGDYVNCLTLTPVDNSFGRCTQQITNVDVWREKTLKYPVVDLIFSLPVMNSHKYGDRKAKRFKRQTVMTLCSRQLWSLPEGRHLIFSNRKNIRVSTKDWHIQRIVKDYKEIKW